MSICFIMIDRIHSQYTAPEINILPVPDIVSGSLHFVPVIRISCRSQVAMYIQKDCDLDLDYALEHHNDRGPFMNRHSHVRTYEIIVQTKSI